MGKMEAAIADPRAGDLLGPQQAAAYLGLRKREFSYLVEAGLVVPAARRAAGPLQYDAGSLDSVLRMPLGWDAARAAHPRLGSPWAGLAGSAAERGTLVRDTVQQLRAAGVGVWARYSSRADQWTLDWEPRPEGPEREHVRQLLPDRLARAVDAGRLVLLGPVGQTMHWAHAMTRPGASCVVDTETTGLGPDARIVEIAVLDGHTGETLVDTLVRPGVPIPARASGVHGITDSMVRSAPEWDEVLPRVLGAVGSRTPLAYNAPFDCRMIQQHCRALGLGSGPLRDLSVWGCLMRRRSAWLGTTTPLRLNGGHRARRDTEAAYRLLHELVRTPATLLSPTADSAGI
ncbi:3'-5' exonuclease [Streptomyces yaizuensis]|uniref:3'-5' exonuclease n=1 Tax=Streptomyces yaizuensis TaxID=2989713 RepID=A0ABQ5P6D5_9ACTN|nr:3'-5' exonuclease [Streptomyces sp. YSPA8]GLF98163.1 3'-5' exonuclease [Streptomyces sp. YSPA8]